jgi:hypothetical protein
LIEEEQFALIRRITDVSSDEVADVVTDYLDTRTREQKGELE